MVTVTEVDTLFSRRLPHLATFFYLRWVLYNNYALLLRSTPWQRYSFWPCHVIKEPARPEWTHVQDE